MVAQEKPRASTCKKRTADAMSNPSRTNDDDEGPACTSCRKRKTKCTREQPCSQCHRLDLECTYDEHDRPGFKVGTIEGINRRLSTLENMFLGQGLLFETLMKRLPDSLASSNGDLSARAQALKTSYLTAVEKRDHITQESSRHDHSAQSVSAETCEQSDMPSYADLVMLVEFYFQHFHHWIPVIHISTFWNNFRNEEIRPGLRIILLAMTSICIKHESRLQLSASQRTKQSERCRNEVILAGMNQFSTKNLQAMVIIAFDIINSGKGPSSWSIIGSMTRTAEHLLLSVEEEARDTVQETDTFMMRRVRFMPKSTSWKESEERRRLFWAVFLMDRFCSIATGWNNSLTSADIHRRLPCEGALWQAETPTKAPMFGVVDQVKLEDYMSSPRSDHPGDIEQGDVIGGYAFCVEATENLNLVTKFFLQHSLNFENSQVAQLWLMKFKELDLRLIRWRLFLSPRWRNACALNQDGNMDPNLTLAHMMHNTAVIQLHQAVAYPGTAWKQFQTALSNITSSETCLAAAREIAVIARHFLEQSVVLTSPQFSFCLFIAARTMIAHAQHHSETVDPLADSITTSLHALAQRHHGAGTEIGEKPHNLSSHFANRIENLLSTLTRQRNEGLDLHRNSSHQQDTNVTASSLTHSFDNGQTHQRSDHYGNPLLGSVGNFSPNAAAQTTPGSDSLGFAYPPLPVAFDYSWPLASQPASQVDSGERLEPDQLHASTVQEYPQNLNVNFATDFATHPNMPPSVPNAYPLDFGGTTLQGMRISTFQGS